jgi:hypothetical protein
MKFERIHYFAFLGAFVVGCVAVYLSPIEHKTVFVYPTPSNWKNLQYKDASGSCFGMKMKKVECTKDAKSIPVQNIS